MSRECNRSTEENGSSIFQVLIAYRGRSEVYFLAGRGRDAPRNRLTPHPGPLPIEGRGSRAPNFVRLVHPNARSYRVEIQSRVERNL